MAQPGAMRGPAMGPGKRGPAGPVPKIENPGRILKRILGYVFKNYGLHCIVVLGCIVGSVLASVQGTLFTKTLIDDYIEPMLHQQIPDFAPLLQAMGRVAGFYLLGVLCSYAQARIMVNVTQGTMKNLRDDMFAHMSKLPIRYFDTNTHGDIMSVYTNDIDTLRQMISQSIPQMINSVITVTSVLISMISLSLPLTLLNLLMTSITVVTAKKVVGRSGKYFKVQQTALGALNGYIEEHMEGQKVVKVFCHEEKSMEEFKALNDALYENAYNANKFANLMGPINAQLGNLTYVVIACAGSVLAIHGVGGFSLGSLVSFLTFTKSFNMPINQVAQQLNSIVMALAGGKRVFDLLDEKQETDEGYVTLVPAIWEKGELKEAEKRTGIWAWKHPHKSTGITEYVELKGDVVFDDVDFGYTDEKIVLHNIKMFAQPGQKLAFVGSTGAGKTTIMNLVNRFYDIQDGKIRYDGININKIKKADLRRSLGIVLQETHLFTATVMENIRFGRLDATDGEVIAAAKLANADSFIRQLPDGYDTVLTGDGANLSQGQRQLLAIARAAVADPPVLILDEATSSIDTRTEKIVQDGMDRLMLGRTTFVIAHRLSTVKNSDCIMVLEQGRIIERGTHEELLEEKGKYYQLYTGSAIG